MENNNKTFLGGLKDSIRQMRQNTLGANDQSRGLTTLKGMVNMAKSGYAPDKQFSSVDGVSYDNAGHPITKLLKSTPKPAGVLGSSGIAPSTAKTSGTSVPVAYTQDYTPDTSSNYYNDAQSSQGVSNYNQQGSTPNMNPYNPQGYIDDYARLLTDRNLAMTLGQGLYSRDSEFSPEQNREVKGVADQFYNERLNQVGQLANREWENRKEYGSGNTGMDQYGQSNQSSQKATWNPIQLVGKIGKPGIELLNSEISKIASSPTITEYKDMNNRASTIYQSYDGTPSVAEQIQKLGDKQFLGAAQKNVLVETLAKTIQPGLAVNDSIYDQNGNPDLTKFGQVWSTIQKLAPNVQTVTGLPANEAKHMLDAINQNVETYKRKAQSEFDSTVGGLNESLSNSGVSMDIASHPSLLVLSKNLGSRQQQYSSGVQSASGKSKGSAVNTINGVINTNW